MQITENSRYHNNGTRFEKGVVGGMKNPHRAAILKDIRDCVLKKTADRDSPAIYWSQEEQEARLEAVFKAWDEKGVWTEDGYKVRPAVQIIMRSPL